MAGDEVFYHAQIITKAISCRVDVHEFLMETLGSYCSTDSGGNKLRFPTIGLRGIYPSLISIQWQRYERCVR
jgi:hypothetical protein